MGSAGADDRHVQLVLPSRTDGRDLGFLTHLAGDYRHGIENTLAPYPAGVFDGDLVVLDADPDRLGALALEHDHVPSSVFHLHREIAAHVGTACSVEGAGGQEACDGRSARAGNAGTAKRTSPKYYLVLWSVGMGSRRDFVPQNLVANSLAADKVLVFHGVVGRDRTRREIHTEDLAGISVAN